MVEVLHTTAMGPFAATIERLAMRRAGRTLRQTVCVVWRFDGERCVEMWAHFEDQPAADAFWAGF